MNKRMCWAMPAALVGVALCEATMAPPLSAGRFEILDVSTEVLANTATGFEFAVHSTARWEGDQSTSGFNRIFRTFWWVSQEGWCNNEIPGRHCGTDGRVFHAPPFFPGYTIHCNSGNGCAANKQVTKPCCDVLFKLYSGKADVVNLHGGTSEDDEEGASTEEVPCQECGGGGGGCPLLPDTDTWLIGATGAPSLAVEQLRFGLERVEKRPETTIYLEEWAVLTFDAGWPSVRQASTEAFGARVGASAHAFAAGDGGRSTVLVVESVEHPHNARHIPAPTLRPLDVLLELENVASQEFLFRAEVAATGAVDDVTFLDASPLLPRDPVRSAILTNLQLEYADVRRHRSVVYGKGVLTTGGRVVVENGLELVPRCCCDDSCCFVEPGFWLCPCDPCIPQ